MSELSFSALGWLPLGWIVLGVLILGAYGIWQRYRGLCAFASARLLPRIAPPVGWARGATRLGLIALALACLVVALLEPRWGARTETVRRRGIDVFVLLDVSRSMLAEDIAPDRLERAKLAIRDDLLPALGGDRIGLITFAGVPTLACPLTNDYGFFRLALEDVSARSAPRGGTMIGDAIRLAGQSFQKKLDTDKVIILITDGEDHDSYPVQAAQGVWKDMKAAIVAVALGDPTEGARIPLGPTGRYLHYEGQTVWSKADFAQMRAIAAVSDLNGFVGVGTRDFNLGDIYRKKVLPAMRVRDLASEETIKAPSQSHWFVFAALGLVLLDSFIPDGPSRRRHPLPARLDRKEAA